MTRETPRIPKLSDGEAELQAQAVSFRECSFSCLPDSVIVAILSKVSRADYLARCSATSKLIRDLARQVHNLAFNEAQCIHTQSADTSETILTRLLAPMAHLQDLRIMCTYRNASLQAWLRHTGTSLRSLSLSLAPDDWDALRMVFVECPNLCQLELLDFELRSDNDEVSPPRPAIAPHPTLSTLTWHSRLMPLTDRTLAVVLALLPALVTLEVHCFDGLSQPHIRHGVLVTCKVVSETAVGSLTVEAPHLRNLWTNNVSDLVVRNPHCLERMRMRICDPNLDPESQPLASAAFGNAQSLYYLDLVGGQWRNENLVQILHAAGPTLEHLQLAMQVVKDSTRFAFNNLLTPFPRLWRLSVFGPLTTLPYVAPLTHHMGFVHMGMNRDEETVGCRPAIETLLESNARMRGMAFSMNEMHITPPAVRNLMKWANGLRERYCLVDLVVCVHHGLRRPEDLDACDERCRAGVMSVDFYGYGLHRCPARHILPT